jgi:glutaredoxin 3
MHSGVAIEIYTKGYCGYCRAATELLRARGATFTEIDLVAHPDRRAEMIARANGRRTVPQIFIRGESIGGWDRLADLERAGRLDDLLAPCSTLSR